MSTSPLRRPAVTDADLHPILAGRWSPRGFDPQADVPDETLRTLLEAARWAASAGNSQPWRFLVARRGTPDFDAVFGALTGGNRQWAGAASVLIVAAAQTVNAEGAPMRWAQYDTGQAVAHLQAQAQVESLHVHQMGGFDPAALSASFELPETVEPLTVIAIGTHAPDADLPEPFASREVAERVRRPLDELLLRPLPR
jgi:nitroreductase